AELRPLADHAAGCADSCAVSPCRTPMLAMWPSANEGMVPSVGWSMTSPLPSESTLPPPQPKLPDEANESALPNSELYPPERKTQSSALLSGADCAYASRAPAMRVAAAAPARAAAPLSSERREKWAMASSRYRRVSV